MRCGIRPARIDEAEALSALLTELCERFVVHEFSEEGRRHLLASMSPEALRGNLEAGFDVLVAEEPGSGRLAGVVASRDDSHLFHLVVAADFQRRGLARRLWETARDRCIERAGTERFTVNATRYALEAYKRLGFRPTGEPAVERGVVSYPMEFVVAGRSLPGEADGRA